MNKKLIKTILLITLLFLMLAIVSANEVSDNSTICKVAKYRNDTHNVEVEKNCEKVVEKKNIKKEENTKTATESEDIEVNDFSKFHDTLTSDTYDTITMNIKSDIRLGDDTEINKTIKNLTINGNGKTINGDDQYRFLKILSGTTVTINNIKITNCSLNKGGAIFSEGTLTITNSTLNNNTARDGGAIHNQYGNLTIQCTNLTNNTAEEDGGAIYNQAGILTITNTNLTNNTAYIRGGAINNYDYANMTLINSTLTHNTAETGGAIENSEYTNIILTGNTLTHNNATIGGAIHNYWYTNISLTNNTLTHNNASSGGAINNYAINMSITDIELTYNTAEGVGGAIYSYYSTLNINNSNLNYNKGKWGGAIANHHFVNMNLTKNTNLQYNNATYGGAIYNYEYVNTSITDTKLAHNTAIQSGGAIYNNYTSTMILNNNTLTNNTANHDGGAISNLNHAIMNLTGNNITHNTAGIYGGAIYSNNGNLTITQNNLTNNTSEYGGAIENWFGTLNMTNSALNNNNATHSGGAIKNHEGNLNITNSNLNNNTGGAINSVGNIIITNTTLNNNNGGAIINRGNIIITLTNMDYNNGTAMCLYGSIDITNSTLNNNNGVAIISDGNLTIINNTLNNNKGRAIISGGNINITNSTLNNNTAYENDGYGGTIFSSGNLTITGCILNNNNAREEGGAIYGDYGSNITICNSTLNNNNATDEGGAISNRGILTIINSTLNNNTAETYGGVINNYKGIINIIGTNLTKNTARFGGAIYGIDSKNITIFFSNFSNNNAREEGGTVYGANITVVNSNFTANKGGITGGAICGGINSTIILTNSNLSYNVADWGGAINSGSGNLIITNSTFKYNGARISGGAIGNYGNLTLIHNLFLNNTSDFAGAIYIPTHFNGITYTKDAEIVAINNTFINNTPETWAINKKNDKNIIELLNNDYYVPSNGTVKIYVDNKYMGDYILENDIIKDFELTNENHIIKLTLTEKKESNYINNTYILNTNTPSKKVTMSVEDSKVLKYENTKINIHFNQTINEGSIKIYIDNKLNNEYNITNNTNNISINTGQIRNNLGYYEIKVEYTGKYYIPTVTGILTVQTTTKIVTTVNNATNTKANVKILLTDIDNQPLSNAKLKITYQGITIDNIITDNKGITLTLTDLPPKNYELNIDYPGNQTHLPSNKTISITIYKHENKITTTNTNNTITILVTNDENKNVPNMPTNIKLPNTILSTKTDTNGKITIPINLTPGNYNINITTLGDENNYPTSQILNINIPKIPTQTTLTILNTRAGNVIVTGTIKNDKGQYVKEGKITIKEGKNTIATAKINNGTYTITTNIISKGTYILQAQYEETKNYLASNSTKITIIVTPTKTKLNASITGNNVGYTNITAILTDTNGKKLSSAQIITTYTNGTKITSNTDNNGKINIPLNLENGTHTLTITYPGNNTYDPITTTISTTIDKNTPIITLNPIKGIIGENITLTAHLLDQNGNPVNGGNLAFKLNGKTLRSDGRFDSTVPAMKFKVENGLVTYTIKADLYLRNAKNLTASYSGNYKYYETTSPSVTAQIQKRYAQVTVTSTPSYTKQYETLTFTVKAKDTTKNGKNNTLIYTDTKVMLKVNGVTLKDNKGKILYLTLDKNAQTTYKYTIPKGTGGITASKKARNYTVTAIFVGDNYYPGAKNTTKFQVTRSATYVNITQAKVTKTNVLSVKATLKDYKQNNLIGTNKVTIKINGKNYVDPKNGKAKYWTVKDGSISLKNIRVDPTITIKRVMLVTGERQAYLEGRAETSNIIRT